MKIYRHGLHLTILLVVVGITLPVSHGCQQRKKSGDHTFTVDYKWDSQMQVLAIRDSTSNKEVNDAIVKTKILEEGARILPRWIRASRLTRAKGTFHIHFFANGTTDIIETHQGIEGVTDFIGDPDTTALMMAAHEGRVDRVEQLVNQGEEVNAKDQLGNTALMATISSSNIEILRFLLDHGADINLRNIDGETALTLSAFSGQADMLKELVRRDAVFDCENATDRATLLSAERRRRVRIISLLKKIGQNCGRLAQP